MNKEDFELHEKDDLLWGIERDPQSPMRGQIVVPLINLWNSVKRTQVVGTALHGERVHVINNKRGPDGHWYYRVVVNRTEQRGWVSAPFLERRGRDE